MRGQRERKDLGEKVWVVCVTTELVCRKKFMVEDGPGTSYFCSDPPPP